MLIYKIGGASVITSVFHGLYNQLAQLLREAYQEQPEMDAYANLPPDWGKKMEISCSS